MTKVDEWMKLLGFRCLYSLSADWATNQSKKLRQIYKPMKIFHGWLNASNSRKSYTSAFKSREIQYGGQRRQNIDNILEIVGLYTLNMNDTQFHIAVNAVMSFAGLCICLKIIPMFREMFIRANLFGMDMSKKDKIKV